MEELTMLARAMKISDASDKQDYETVRRAIEFLTKKFRDQQREIVDCDEFAFWFRARLLPARECFRDFRLAPAPWGRSFLPCLRRCALFGGRFFAHRPSIIGV